jgi:hypothetical protein
MRDLQQNPGKQGSKLHRQSTGSCVRLAPSSGHHTSSSSSEEQFSKGEHTYGWSSASGGRCKAIKDRLRFTAISILMLVKF